MPSLTRRLVSGPLSSEVLRRCVAHALTKTISMQEARDASSGLPSCIQQFVCCARLIAA